MQVLSYLKRHESQCILLILCVFIFGLSLYANAAYFFLDKPQALRFFPPFLEGVNQNHNAHLGAEYYFIAQAIASGKGFSNPFQTDTGPTAWMPPLYPFLLALLIKLLKVKMLVAGCIVFFKNLILVAAGLLIYEIAKKTRIAIRPEITLILYCLVLMTSFRWFFQITHDEWLLLLLLCIMLPCAVFIRDNRINSKQAALWGISGGLAMLASPIAGCVWLGISVTTGMRNNFFKPLLLSLFLFFTVCSPWFIRNYLVFDKFILMKSNFYFDLYTTNYETEKGLFNEALFIEQHPVWTTKNNPDSLYRKSGEVKFMDTYKDKFLEAFKQNPRKYLFNIKNRLLAALLIYPPYGRYEEATMVKKLMHALPLLCIMLLVFYRSFCGSSYRMTAVFIYSIYLLPYILVNYYIRYSIPLTPFKVLFIFWGLDLLVARLSAFLPNKKPTVRVL